MSGLLPNWLPFFHRAWVWMLESLRRKSERLPDAGDHEEQEQRGEDAAEV